MLHVGAYLMGASRFEHTLHERGVAETLKHAVVCHGRLARVASRRKHRHAQAVFRVAPDVALYASGVFLEVAPHQCRVAPVGGLVEELRPQLRLCVGRLCHHEQSAGVLVNAVYQSHLRVIGVVCGQVAQVPRHGVDQRAVEVAATRMHHQSGRLVHHHQFIVLIHDVHRYVLRLYRGVEVRAVEHQSHHVAAAHLVVALHRPSVHIHESRIGGVLYAVAAGVLQLLGQVFVYPDGSHALVGLHAEVLVQLLVAAVEFAFKFYFVNVFCHCAYAKILPFPAFLNCVVEK